MNLSDMFGLQVLRAAEEETQGWKMTIGGKFVELPDYRSLREPLFAHCDSLGVKGTMLLAEEGINGTIAPLSAKQGATVLPTGSSATVVELTVPAGNYVVLAKTQLSHTGAGDTVECFLKAGVTTIDQIAMKTLPALAAIPASLQAVTTTTSPTQLSVQCNVMVANGAANFSSLIAIPTA